MPDDLDIFNENDDFQRGDDDEDEDNDEMVPNGTDMDESDDEFVKAIINEPEYLQAMNYLMFVNGP